MNTAGWIFFSLCHLIPFLTASYSPAQDRTRFEFEAKHMGTTFRIVLYASDRTTAKKAADAAFARVAELDGIMSDYKKDSELMRLCKKFEQTVADPVKVSRDLFYVLQKAEELSQKSDGAFDVTVGPVVQLWRLARRTQELPDPKELAAARAKVGYQKVKLDPTQQTVQLLTPGMQLDLGGIAKGYAADEALKLLRDQYGITQALVAASGDITCGDPPPGQDGWIVDIAPIAKNQKPRRLQLANAAVSTSGDLEQFVEIRGVRYSHVLDPKTGLGLTGRRSVTVIAPQGITADSMTKAVSVLPVETALKLVEDTPGAACYIVVLDPQEKPIITASRRFAQYEVQTR
ncbi:MAG: FAD:protein FMN transferase [Gemmataceae bacterium]|nr:FAD:protein FMN transferase [Gemmata sp.]MDW8199201.1 FAD:protein FMN transferase [Gemmataceae bacterium]